jgi:hypothetical protein
VTHLVPLDGTPSYWGFLVALALCLSGALVGQYGLELIGFARVRRPRLGYACASFGLLLIGLGFLYWGLSV